MRIWCRAIAGLVLLTQLSCSRSPVNSVVPTPAANIKQVISKGNAAMESMQDAMMKRDYNEFFQQYEVLRQCYIDVAFSLRDSSEQPIFDDAISTLGSWKPAVDAARAIWHELESPADDGPLFETTADRKAFLDQLDKQAKEARTKKNNEWAPIESKLDEAIEIVRAKRTK